MSPATLLLYLWLLCLASLPGPGAIDYWLYGHDVREIHKPHAEELE